jgi:hypothetical protein
MAERDNQTVPYRALRANSTNCTRSNYRVLASAINCPGISAKVDPPGLAESDLPSVGIIDGKWYAKESLE